MRVVFATRNRAIHGGLEVYVRSVIAALSAARTETALLVEFDAPRTSETIDAGMRVPAWCVSESGRQGAIEAMLKWRPDVICDHGIEDGALADRLIAAAPAVFFALDYRGLCISGEKTHKLPTATPCHRKFGAECLLQYYPRRCGGLSPMTMWRDYVRQTQERARLARFSAIVTTSDYMRDEYASAVPPERVHKIPMLVRKPLVPRTRTMSEQGAPRILFAARMTTLKGGHLLLDALPEVSRALDKGLEVTMAGDGPMRSEWQSRAPRVESSAEGIAVRFPGWLAHDQLAAQLAQTDLLAMPSLWPEPFGLIGAEAARLGIPSAAFDVGGISEWLIDGASGALAPAEPPSAAGLASAIVRCLADNTTYARLSRGALENSRRFDADVHVAALLGVFERVAGRESREVRIA